MIDPVDPVERFLAQARDDYSDQLPAPLGSALAVGAILIGGGLFAAWRTSRITMGTMAAAIASAAGSVIYVTLVVLVNILSAPSPDPSAMCQRAFATSATFPQCLCRCWRCLASSSERLAASSEGQSTSSELHNPTAEFGFRIPPVY